MGRPLEHNEKNVVVLVYCLWSYKNTTHNLAFFIEEGDFGNEEIILYSRGLKGVFSDFYRIRVMNESRFLYYVSILEKRQHFEYINSKDVYIK